MKKETGFYMIYLQGGGAPTYRHMNYHTALQEAKRLASLTDRKAYILKSHKSVTVKKEFEEFKLAKPDEDSLPF